MPPTLQERFWAKVDKTSMPGHWLWTGSINPKNGYGKIRVGNRFLYAHRLSLAWATGNEGIGLDACHSETCPRNCVRDECLSWKSHRENLKEIKNLFGRPRKIAREALPLFREAA
jgi:hypothetical protein